MVVFYKKKNLNCSTETNNEDIEIKVVSSNEHVVVELEAKEDIEILKVEHTESIKLGKDSEVYLNGYQTWTDTNEFPLTHKEKDASRLPKVLLKKYGFDLFGDYGFYKYSKNKLHGYDLFYVRGKKEYFSYSLNYRNAFLVYEVDKKNKTIKLISLLDGTTLPKGNSLIAMDYKVFSSIQEGEESFKKDFPLLNTPKILGYTSWYNYYQDINEDIINRDLEALDSRFDLFQIDDGYESYVGDWLEVDKKKFPNGLKPICDSIHQKGYKVGLWLAPFVAETKSSLFQNHKELFARDENGDLLSCGGNWSGFYALDLSKEETWAYIEKFLTHYMDMGVDFFKLDFLYAAARVNYPHVSRAKMSYDAYSRIRKILKDKIILGCGATLFSSYKNFEYARIGADVSLKFDDVWYMKFMHRERISTKNTIINTITRYIMNDRLFGNDPDVFVLRDNNISLSKEQKHSLIKIDALFGNLMMTSDNIATYSTYQKEFLDEALDIYKNATDREVIKQGEDFVISYSLRGEKHTFRYNSRNGVHKNG